MRKREDGRQTERNWRREIPSVSVIVSCCQTLGNERDERTKERNGREIVEEKGCIVTELRESESKRD